MPEHVHVVGSVDHGADARQVEAAGEDRREAEQLPLVVGQEVVGPLHRMAERELSFRPRCRPLQQPESIGESIPDLDRAHRRHSGGGQLDAQREPVEGLADLGHRGGGLRLREPEVGPDGSGPVDEQRDGVGGHAPRQSQRCHGEHRLPVDREGLARRREDLHAAGPSEDRLDRRSRRGQDVLAVVHHQKELPTAERIGHRVDECRVALWRDAEHGRDGRGDGGRVADRRQLDHPHAVGELAGHLGPDFEGQPGLADPADAAQRDQPARRARARRPRRPRSRGPPVSSAAGGGCP